MRRLGLYLTSLVPVAIVLLALTGHRRYGFFVLLRLVVSIAAAILALMAYKQSATGWMCVMIGTHLLFSPLVPIQLRRDVWRVIDMGGRCMTPVVRKYSVCRALFAARKACRAQGRTRSGVPRCLVGCLTGIPKQPGGDTAHRARTQWRPGGGSRTESRGPVAVDFPPRPR
jgi:hypothetical protein